MAYTRETLITSITPSRWGATVGLLIRTMIFSLIPAFGLSVTLMNVLAVENRAVFTLFFSGLGAVVTAIVIMTRKIKSGGSRAQAVREIEEALTGIADDGFKPTKHDYDKLFTYGRAVPFTIHGISGGSLSRTRIENREGPKEYAIHLNVGAVDDGTESFKRLLQNAIASNSDIKVAADAQR